MIVRMLSSTLLNDTFGLCYALPVCFSRTFVICCVSGALQLNQLMSIILLIELF